jgi:hypothetical protein
MVVVYPRHLSSHIPAFKNEIHRAATNDMAVIVSAVEDDNPEQNIASPS